LKKIKEALGDKYVGQLKIFGNFIKTHYPDINFYESRYAFINSNIFVDKNKKQVIKMIKLHKLMIEEIGERGNIRFDERLLERRFGKKSWHLMDQIQFSTILGDVQKHQRIFVVQQIERRQYVREVKELDPKSKVKETQSIEKIWCLKKFKLDHFADIEIKPEWIINLKEFKLVDDLIKTQL
jgi:hypothetical protein